MDTVYLIDNEVLDKGVSGVLVVDIDLLVLDQVPKLVVVFLLTPAIGA